MIETPPRISPLARWFAALAVAALPLLSVAATVTWWQDRLPDPMPSHWGAGNQVDGATSLSALVTTFTVIAAGGALVAAVGAVLLMMKVRVRRWVITAGAAVGGFAAGTWLMLATLALDAPTAAQAGAPTWHITALPLGMGLVAGFAYAACPPPPPYPAATGRPGPDAPRIDLPAGQRAAYSETTYPGRPAYLLAGLVLLVGVGLAAWTTVWAAVPMLLAAGLALAGSTARVLVNARGLRIGFGPWGWPRVTVPLREIEVADATTARPREWGGWGYRIRADGSRGLVLRSGPAVELTLSGERRFVASVRDARTAAGLVNSLLDAGR